MATIPFQVLQRIAVKPTVAATTTTVTLPNAPTVGSTQILLFAAGSSQNLTATPTGWTQRISNTVQQGNISTYDHTTSSTTDNTVTVTHGSGIGTIYLIEAVGVVGYSNAVASNGAGPVASYATASITPDVSSGAAWLIVLAAQNENNPVTPSGGWTGLKDSYFATASGVSSLYSAVTDAVVTAGSAVTETFTPSANVTGYETAFLAYKVNTPSSSLLASEPWTGADGAAWPAQWTTSGAPITTTIQANAGRMVTAATGYAYGRQYLSGMAASPDMEALVTFTPTSAGVEQYLLFSLASDNTALGANGWYPQNGYSLRVTLDGSFDLQRQSANVQNYTQSAPAMRGSTGTITAGTAYKMRFRVKSGVVQVRFWLASATEPSTWAGTWTDPAPLPAGRFSISPCNGNDAVARTFTVDDLTVTGANPVTLINTVRTANSGVTDASIVVPAGVTADHLGILTVEAANQGLAAMAVPTGWTMRGKNPGTGGSTGTLYIFTRKGGVKAGDTVTATLPSNTGATTTAAWYDTGGRDIEFISAVWDTASADVTTVTFPAPGHTGNRDVILVAANRTTNANTLGTPAGVTLDYTGQESAWFGGAFFGHAANVASQAYTATWTPSAATSHNVNAIQFALTAAAGVPGPKIATLTDDFTTKDTSKWWWQSTTAAVVSGGQYVSTPNSAYSGWTTSQATYDLTSSSYSVQLVQAPNVGNGTTECYVQLSVNATNNKLNFDVNNGTLGAYYKLATTGAVTTVGTVAYNAATMKYLRISHDGTKVHWHYSADGTTWTEIGTGWAPTFDITNLVADLGSGYYGTEPSPGTAIFDNVNLLQTALNKLKLGANTVGLYVGSLAVSKAYIGATQIWP